MNKLRLWLRYLLRLGEHPKEVIKQRESEIWWDYSDGNITEEQLDKQLALLKNKIK